jgi:hypothetical protein
MEPDNKKLAFMATLHCVIGCGIGDTSGLIVGTILNWPAMPTMILGIILGFIGGYGLTMVPLLKKGFSVKSATKITVASETASIAVMETGENLTAFLIPGVLAATIFSYFFWVGLMISVVAGFLAAYPVNYFMIKKGSGHGHMHH